MKHHICNANLMVCVDAYRCYPPGVLAKMTQFPREFSLFNWKILTNDSKQLYVKFLLTFLKGELNIL